MDDRPPADPDCVAAANAGGDHVFRLRAALARYELSRAPSALDQAFVAATAAIAQLRARRHGPAGDRPGGDRPGADADEVRALLARLPEFAQLVEVATGEAQRAAGDAAAALWDHFGLLTAPPVWDQVERSAARLLIACACVVWQPEEALRLRGRLRRLAAGRWAARLSDELRAAGEPVWLRALGERYESVRRRYAPRAWWRHGQLCELLQSNDETAAALRARLTAWLSDGLDFDALAAELEAAFVLTRNPERVA